MLENQSKQITPARTSQNIIKQTLGVFYDNNSNADKNQFLNKYHTNRSNHLQPYKSPQPAYNPPIHINNGNSDGSFFYKLIILAATILFLFFLFDLRSEYDLSAKELEIKKKECVAKYDLNQCWDPVQILVEQCKKLRTCYQDQKKVKFTIVFAKVFTDLLRTIVEEMGLICLVAVLIVIGFFFCRGGENSMHAKRQ